MRIISIFLVLLLVPLVFADGVLIQSPANDSNIESGKDYITFSIDQDYRTLEIYTCTVIVDGEPYKNITINTVLGGQTRQTSQKLTEGTHTWMMTCETDEGEITSELRTVKVFAPVESDADVSPSGQDGSLIHEVTMKNTLEQKSLFISEIVPGDYLGITLAQGPSRFSEEFYFLNKRLDGNKNYLVFEYGQDSFDIYEGKNKTIPIGSGNVILYFHSLVGFRANLIVYPSVYIPPPEVEEVEKVEEEEIIIEEEIEEEIIIEEVEEEIPEVDEEIPEEKPPKKKRRQGFFSWIGTLLSNIFGS